MTGYCAACGWHKFLDEFSKRCAECLLEWAEAFKAATKGRP